MTFTEKLVKYFDVDRRRNQVDVAADCGLSESRISKLKTGERKVRQPELAPLAEAMGLSVAYLVDDRLEDERPETAAYSFDEKTVIQLMRALKLDGQEALRRLSEPTPASPQVKIAGPAVRHAPQVGPGDSSSHKSQGKDVSGPKNGR